MQRHFTDRTELISRIIALEYEMRLKVKTQNPNSRLVTGAFKIMRWMTHSVLSIDTLSSYYNDLLAAKQQGRNFMIEKYARMDNLIPPINNNPLIEAIVCQETKWLKETSQKYPLAVRNNGAFSNYARAELETYSDVTLELYAKDVFNAARVGRNLVEERYVNLYTKLGYTSIADAERKLCLGEGK